ncbi:MAG: hypothetical protein KAI64_00415 [Thermoplasmata archaeon]|nr:hypothetical protein [Thermoplasmata archaeon]
MTDQEEPQVEITEEVKPALSPMYKPATEDSWLKINFVGNTPTITGYEASEDVTPFHMLAAAEDMKRAAFKIIQFAEIKEAEEREKIRIKQEKEGIQIATKLPRPVPPEAGGFRQGG